MRNAVSLLGTLLLAMAGLGTHGSIVHAQDMPSDYQQVLKVVGKSGDFKANVLKVNIPRNDLHVTIADYPVPTPFGFGGWFALTKGDGADDVMMGDLVLLQEEVNPVMSALLDHGLEVTALHNHFFWSQPTVYFMHIHGHGKALDLANQIKPALDLIGRATTATAAGNPAPPGKPTLDTARIARIVGHEGEENGAVYKITVGRLESEVTPTLKVLRGHGLDVVAIHHHMTNSRPVVIFLHYWGRGPAEKLAAGFKAALDELGKGGKQ